MVHVAVVQLMAGSTSAVGRNQVAAEPPSVKPAVVLETAGAPRMYVPVPPVPVPRADMKLFAEAGTLVPTAMIIPTEITVPVLTAVMDIVVEPLETDAVPLPAATEVCCVQNATKLVEVEVIAAALAVANVVN